MKYILRLLWCTFLSINIGITLASTNHDPILVAVIMVKNEETVMEATLQPFVDGGVDSFFVFDTGSTDNTIAVTQEFFEKNNVAHGCIMQEPFINFAASRNRALDLAHEKFPNAAFMIMFDAEWYLNDARSLVDFCRSCLEQHDHHSSYSIRLLNTAQDFYSARLIRCNRGIRFAGVVHECFYSQQEVRVPGNIYFSYQPAALGVEKSAQRFIRDRELLYQEYRNNPCDTRTLFYLARTCEDLGNLEEAYHLYKKRIAMVGWPEEDYMAVYRLAQTVEKLSYSNTNYSWEEALGYYLKSYEMRPTRAEPLVSIAHYYVVRDRMDAAFLFAKRAVEVPYPSADVLFVQKYVYDYYRYEVLARCSWYINEFKIGHYAAEKAFEARPDYDLARRNAEAYRWKESVIAAQAA